MSILAKVTCWADNRLNPIVVKELRQAVQSKFVTLMIMLLLLAQVISIGGWILVDEHLAAKMTAGRDMFMTLLVGLVVLSSLLVPLYAGARFAFERSDTNMDLLYGTTISPWAIVWGKFLSAAVVAAIIYGACMPFIVLTYLLRGIDVPTILVSLCMAYVILMITTAIAILLASPRLSYGWRIVLGLIELGCVGMSISGAIGYVSALSFLGFGTIFSSREFWAGAGTFIAVSASAILFLLLAAAAMISPPSSNRTMRLRIGMSAIWVVCGVITALWSWDMSRVEPTVAWLIASMLLFAFSLPIAVSERDRLTVRVARTVPRSIVLRIPAFLFYCGSGSGVLWIALTVAGSFLVTWVLAVAIQHGRIPDPDAWKIVLGICLYIYVYCLTAAILTRTLLKRFMTTAYTWVVAILVAALFMAGPLLVSIFVMQKELWDSHDSLILFLNPMVFVYDRNIDSGLRFVSWWAAAVTAIALPGLIAQFIRFKPFAPVTASAMTETNDQPTV